jgi:hypothetical protein
MGKVVTVENIIEKIEQLQKEKNDYATALKELRSVSNWKSGIEQDGRASVKKLYAMYCDLELKIQELKSIVVSEQ